MRMRSGVRLIAFLLLTMAVQASGGDHIYRYKDDSGTVHFTTEFYSIPEKYRSQVVPPAPEPSPPVERHTREAALRIVTASGEYRMGDHDTRVDAARMAIEAAKRQA